MNRLTIICLLLAVGVFSKSAMAELDVVTGEIVSQHHDITIKSQGFIVPFQQTTLAAQVTGDVNHISNHFEPGMSVAKGEILFSIDNTNYLAQVAEAKQRMLEARLALEDEKVRADRAKKDWRMTQSTEPNELAGRDLYVDAAQAALEAAESRLQQAKRDLSLTVVRAPYDGVVKTREISLGDLLMPGAVAGSFIQADVAALELPIRLEELPLIKNIDFLRVELKSVNGGDSISQSVDAYPVSLSADLNKQEQQARLRVKVPLTNSGESKLFVNQYVVAKISIPSSEKLFAIPEEVFTQRNSILSVKGGVIAEKFPEVVYQYKGKKYCLLGDIDSIEVITETPDLYWAGAAVNPVNISMF
ncbi:Secretion protein HlyD [Saccharophagus degradans 2-40]|uniref:Secretion protein HlyD n=2 Tax=Saccharophagus degradans TaxID=86304 RepID=Q21HX1_SACD2|nr:Secretion protein HlyD [Saccharophagus degradans 2-40]